MRCTTVGASTEAGAIHVVVAVALATHQRRDCRLRRHGQHQDRCLALAWSPQKIANRLRLDFPDDPSLEAIYQAVYIRDRGSLRFDMRAPACYIESLENVDPAHSLIPEARTVAKRAPARRPSLLFGATSPFRRSPSMVGDGTLGHPD